MSGITRRMLNQLPALPPGLLSLEAEQLYQALNGPTLIHLPGRREPPLFVSVLLHGNETTGWEAMRGLLQRYREKALPRALSILIGNIDAARYGKRHLPHQPDYNRIWSGEGTPEHVIMREVLEEMRRRGVFASVDVHNNTGRNPHYACIRRLDPRFLQLATLFSRTVVYFLRPLGVQNRAFASLCPAVTIECGRSGEIHGVQHALEYLEACLHLLQIPTHPVAASDLDLFHTVAIVKVLDHVSLGIGQEGGHDLNLHLEIDQLNFRELPVGTSLGIVGNGLGMPLDVRNEAGEEIGERLFVIEDRELRIRRPVIPAMLTLDCEIIRQDCLCYLMERYPL
jgi:Succinylglutamate desuccinylase / Aspartoacylase family